MERLTYKVERKREGDWEKSYYTKHNKQELVDALAAYEDTGLAPEQLRQIDRLYAEKCREVAKLQQRDTPVKVKPIGINRSAGHRVGRCPKCDAIVRDYANQFCGECGCRLEWGSWEEWEELT